MKTRLFVGNLPRATTEDDLNALFAKAGKVTSVELIILQERGNQRCFAFVDMNSKGEAEKAIGMLNGSDLNGQPLKVNVARPREALPREGGWYTDTPPAASHKKPKDTSQRKSA